MPGHGLIFCFIVPHYELYVMQLAPSVVPSINDQNKSRHRIFAIRVFGTIKNTRSAADAGQTR